MIKLRIYPYQRIPAVLDGETRQAVLHTLETLSSQLTAKTKLGATKKLVARFLDEELSFEELTRESKKLGDAAAKRIEKHGGSAT